MFFAIKQLCELMSDTSNHAVKIEYDVMQLPAVIILSLSNFLLLCEKQVNVIHQLFVRQRPPNLGFYKQNVSPEGGGVMPPDPSSWLLLLH